MILIYKRFSIHVIISSSFSPLTNIPQRKEEKLENQAKKNDRFAAALGPEKKNGVTEEKRRGTKL